MVKRKPRRMTEGFNLGQVRTVYGICPECEENSVLVSVIEDYYKCTLCGEDTRQYVNGSIKLIKRKKDQNVVKVIQVKHLV